ncbi:uncharacterized protein RHOBADRAFT_40918 [Rhodotorula graminis WP1]|uniref:Uncharacterized protein n=1 Tax=Rhodotorula graminis (strain WP1) TaxID=578459 RepID=A0A194SCQ6_RHOGW|nr:uncharacterized protein RHOBADRAFT_40918 [Rhodotorula graminis WP1]KPV78372.1 hypothetical protein RHOBADRAFT_40918 [Rhodotorula graminis WP1]
MASTSLFASPLGSSHLAHPSTASSHTLLGLFRPSSSSSSSSRKDPSSSRPAKRTKVASSSLKISSPVLQSTTNLSVVAPTYMAAFEAPRSVRRRGSEAFPSSASLSDDDGDDRAASPPPPYRNSALSVDGDGDDDSACSAAVDILEEKALVDEDQVERRMARWDAERRLCRAEQAVETDVRVDEELRRMGL